MSYEHALVGGRRVSDYIGYHGTHQSGMTGPALRSFPLPEGSSLKLPESVVDSARWISRDPEHTSEYDRESVKTIFFAFYGVRLLRNQYAFGAYRRAAGDNRDAENAMTIIRSELQSCSIEYSPGLPSVARIDDPVMEYVRQATRDFHTHLVHNNALPADIAAIDGVNSQLLALYNKFAVLTLEVTRLNNACGQYRAQYRDVAPTFDIIPGMYSQTWRATLGSYCASRHLDSEEVIVRSLMGFSNTIKENILCNGSITGQAARMVAAAKVRRSVEQAIGRCPVKMPVGLDYVESALRRWGNVTPNTRLDMSFVALMNRAEVFQFYSVNMSADPGVIYHGLTNPHNKKAIKRQDIIISELAMARQIVELADSDPSLSFLGRRELPGFVRPVSFASIVLAKPKSEVNSTSKVLGGWRSIYVTSSAVQLPLHVMMNAGKVGWCDKAIAGPDGWNNSLYGFSPFHGGITELTNNLRSAAIVSRSQGFERNPIWVAGYSDNLYVYCPSNGGTLLSLDGSKFESGTTFEMGEAALLLLEMCAPGLRLSDGVRAYLNEILTSGSIDTAAVFLKEFVFIGGMSSGTACTFLLNHMRMMVIVDILYSRGFTANLSKMFAADGTIDTSSLEMNSDETFGHYIGRIDRMCDAKRQQGMKLKDLRDQVALLIPYADMELESTSDDHPLTPRARDFHHWPFVDIPPPDRLAATGRTYITNLDLLGFDVCYYPFGSESKRPWFGKMAVLSRSRLLKSAVLRNKLDTTARTHGPGHIDDPKGLIHELLVLTGRCANLLNLYLMGAFAYPSIYSIVLAEWCGAQWSLQKISGELLIVISKMDTTLRDVISSTIADVLKEGVIDEDPTDDNRKKFVENLARKAPDFMYRTIEKCVNGDVSTSLPPVISLFMTLHAGTPKHDAADWSEAGLGNWDIQYKDGGTTLFSSTAASSAMPGAGPFSLNESPWLREHDATRAERESIGAGEVDATAPAPVTEVEGDVDPGLVHRTAHKRSRSEDQAPGRGDNDDDDN